jgi:RNA polymerase sigma factor (sigma-70 family)
MARGWASPILQAWYASPKARVLTAAEEIARAGQIAEGAAARSALREAMSPSVKDYLDQIGDDDEIIKPADRSDLATAIVDTALDAWATSDRSAHDFVDHLSRIFRCEFHHHCDIRRHREKDFWVIEDAWLAEHFNAAKLRESLDGRLSTDASLWEQLAVAGAAVNDLVQHGLAVVPAVVAKLWDRGIQLLSREDAEAEAAAALRRIAWKFSQTQGKGFHSFAFPSLVNHLKSKIRTARGHTEDLAKDCACFERAKSRLWLRLQSQPTNDQVLSAIDSWGDRKKENFRRYLEVGDPVPHNWDGTPETLPNNRDKDAEEIVERRERAGILHTAKQQLTDEQQTVLTCRYTHGMSKAETARQTGTPVAAVARLEKKALAQLRGLCQELAHDE